MTAPLNIVQATPADRSTVLSILVETARWLQAREHGRRLLRLDCVGHNERLNEYYRQRLTFAGECETFGMTFSRYQKEL